MCINDTLHFTYKEIPARNYCRKFSVTTVTISSKGFLIQGILQNHMTLILYSYSKGRVEIQVNIIAATLDFTTFLPFR